MKVNTLLLDAAIDKSGLKIGYICETLGLSRNGFDKKRKGKTPFRKAEIIVLCSLLGLNAEEGEKIFYPQS